MAPPNHHQRVKGRAEAGGLRNKERRDPMSDGSPGAPPGALESRTNAAPVAADVERNFRRVNRPCFTWSLKLPAERRLHNLRVVGAVDLAENAVAIGCIDCVEIGAIEVVNELAAKLEIVWLLCTIDDPDRLEIEVLKFI